MTEPTASELLEIEAIANRHGLSGVPAASATPANAAERAAIEANAGRHGLAAIAPSRTDLDAVAAAEADIARRLAR